LESPTRTLTLQAPRGVEINAGVGDFQASCRKDLLLQSSEGERRKKMRKRTEPREVFQWLMMPQRPGG
ncbi:unnamed protein product, partial [Gadus morhua 'NCC']